MRLVLKDIDRVYVLDEDDEQNNVKIPHFRDDNQPSTSRLDWSTPLNDKKACSNSYLTPVPEMSGNNRDSKLCSSDNRAGTDEISFMAKERDTTSSSEQLDVEPDEISDKVENKEIDDFEYLGMLDDDYLLSLFDEDNHKNAENVSESAEEPLDSTVTEEVPIQLEGNNSLSDPDEDVTELPANTRSNPPRRAKQGITYCEDENNLEDLLQSEYCKF